MQLSLFHSQTFSYIVDPDRLEELDDEAEEGSDDGSGSSSVEMLQNTSRDPMIGIPDAL